MPNHVTTRCVITGPADEVARFKSMVIVEKTEERGDHWPVDRQPKAYTEFDFNAVIPMPAILRGSTAGSVPEFGSLLLMIANANQFSSLGVGEPLHGHEREKVMAETPAGGAFTDRARAFLALHPDTAEAGRVRLKAIAETGYSDWYPWAVDNWGTKWGAYQFEQVSDGSERYEITFQTAWSFPLPIFEKLAERFPLLDFECATFDEGWNFAAFGHFAAGTLDPFKYVTPDETIYARVYGHAPEKDEDDEEAA